jgi:hypothetical protein
MGGGQQTQKGVLHRQLHGILAIWIILFWKHTLPKMQIHRAMSSSSCQQLQCIYLILIINGPSSVHQAIYLQKIWARSS